MSYIMISVQRTHSTLGIYQKNTTDSVNMYHMIAFMHIQDFDGVFLSSEQAKPKKFCEYICPGKHVQGTFHLKKNNNNIKRIKSIFKAHLEFFFFAL